MKNTNPQTNKTRAHLPGSTDKQDLENQRFEIERFCQSHGLPEPCWVEDVVSGSKELADRKIGPLLAELDRGDTLVVSEVSRISRRLLDIMEVLKLVTVQVLGRVS